MSRMKNWVGASAVAMLAGASLVAAPAVQAAPLTSSIAKAVAFAPAADAAPAKPKFGKISVAKGAARDTTAITISGTNFDTAEGKTTVKVGDATLTAAVSASSIAFTMPKLAAGGDPKATISVTSGEASKDFKFTYVIPAVKVTVDKTKLKPVPDSVLLEVTPTGDVKPGDKFTVKNGAGEEMAAEATATATPAEGKVSAKDNKLYVHLDKRASTTEKGTSFTVFNEWNKKGQTIKLSWNPAIPTLKAAVKTEKITPDGGVLTLTGKNLAYVAAGTSGTTAGGIKFSHVETTPTDAVKITKPTNEAGLTSAKAGSWWYVDETKKDQIQVKVPARGTDKKTDKSFTITATNKWDSPSKAMKVNWLENKTALKVKKGTKLELDAVSGGTIAFEGDKTYLDLVASMKLNDKALEEAETAAALDEADSGWFYNATAKSLTVKAGGNDRALGTVNLTAVNKWGNDIKAVKVKYVAPKMGTVAIGTTKEGSVAGGVDIELTGDKVSTAKTVRIGTTDYEIKAEKGTGATAAVAWIDGAKIKVTMPEIKASEWTAGATQKQVVVSLLNEWRGKSNGVVFTYKAAATSVTASPLASDNTEDVTVVITAATAQPGAKVLVDGKPVTATVDDTNKTFSIIMPKVTPALAKDATKTSKITFVNTYGIKSTDLSFVYTGK